MVVRQPANVSHLIPLDVPVPPNLEAAIASGHESDYRYMAFYWIPGGDEIMFDDGRASGTGNWRSYLCYIDHPKISPHLDRWHFGSSDEYAIHWLLLDRSDRRLYVGTSANVQAFLSAQHPPQPSLSATEYEEILRRLKTAVVRCGELEQLIQQRPSRLQAWMDAEASQYEELQAWLDAET
jgi:hypothetical protein